jgi:hypothetical protein
MPHRRPYRCTVVLLWALAGVARLVCRGLFWDGAAFLAKLLETAPSTTSIRRAPMSPG